MNADDSDDLIRFRVDDADIAGLGVDDVDFVALWIDSESRGIFADRNGLHITKLKQVYN